MALICAASQYTREDVLALLARILEARDKMLGPREYRELRKGRAAFEGHSRAQPLSNAPRCYGLNNMVQQPRMIQGPPAALKMQGSVQDEYQHMVGSYLRVSATFILLFPDSSQPC